MEGMPVFILSFYILAYIMEFVMNLRKKIDPEADL